MNYATSAGTPIISIIPALLSKDFLLTGIYGSSRTVLPVNERLRHESLGIQCLRAISKINRLIASGVLKVFLRLTSAGKATKTANRFVSAQITQYLCDSPEAEEAFIQAGIPADRVRCVTFDRDSVQSIGPLEKVLVILSDEPTPEVDNAYLNALRYTLIRVSKMHPTSDIAVRPHPSSPEASTSRSVINSLSVMNSRILIDEPADSPMWRAIDSATTIYGVMSSGLLEALQIGFDEVFGLADLNRHLGYPQPEIRGITWVSNEDLTTTRRLERKSKKTRRGFLPNRPLLSETIASILTASFERKA